VPKLAAITTPAMTASMIAMKSTLTIFNEWNLVNTAKMLYEGRNWGSRKIGMSSNRPMVRSSGDML
jgi:hypothetical protein